MNWMRILSVVRKRIFCKRRVYEIVETDDFGNRKFVSRCVSTSERFQNFDGVRFFQFACLFLSISLVIFSIIMKYC